MSKHVLIPAGGTGSRFKSAVPKQFHLIQGKTVLEWTLAPFVHHADIETIWIAHGEDLPSVHLSTLAQLEAQYPKKIRLLNLAGATRAETVRNACQAIRAERPDDNPWILVHDAARPGLTEVSLKRLMDHLEGEAVGAILAIPVADTLKEAEGVLIHKTLSRDSVWQAQTPQAFKLELLLRALTGDLHRFSDEASAVEALGLSPSVVLGELRNFKLTRPEDGVLMDLILGAS